MKKLTFIAIIASCVISCNSKIKDSKTQIEIDSGTQVVEETTAIKNQDTIYSPKSEEPIGYWVGYFEDASEDDSGKGVYVDEGFFWKRENKINVSIDNISDSIVTGHSVVAGNNRPFSGTVRDGQFQVKEPGDDKYDGEFKFKIEAGRLVGTWTAYKNIEIKNRKYSLEKMTFIYNPDIMLEYVKAYVDWNTTIEEKQKVEIEKNEFEEWARKEFASATGLIYSLNASNTLLKKEKVENLKKGDITIIRNTIYARHGYSFKNRPLRVFFDAQPWYIPVHADIKSDFTEIEKANIKLLLRYEKNAVEYYDYFGRG